MQLQHVELKLQKLQIFILSYEVMDMFEDFCEDLAIFYGLLLPFVEEEHDLREKGVSGGHIRAYPI